MTDIRKNPICTPIASETEKCHPDLGDGRMSYNKNGYYTFERNGQWYVVLERQKMVKTLEDGVIIETPTGSFVDTLSKDRIRVLVELFGWDNLFETNEIESETVI